LVCLELIEGDIYLYNTEYPLRNDNYMIQTNNYGIFQATAANTIFPPHIRVPKGVPDAAIIFWRAACHYHFRSEQCP
ncbi:MAG: hypothetical protein KJ555_13540, partial [Proteobacteria bacterium]|nr:hypothetical protein [Pseudomonadota bacterium]